MGWLGTMVGQRRRQNHEAGRPVLVKLGAACNAEGEAMPIRRGGEGGWRLRNKRGAQWAFARLVLQKDLGQIEGSDHRGPEHQVEGGRVLVLGRVVFIPCGSGGGRRGGVSKWLQT